MMMMIAKRSANAKFSVSYAKGTCLNLDTRNIRYESINLSWSTLNAPLIWSGRGKKNKSF